jgi:Transport and Golgi organisation 2
MCTVTFIPLKNRYVITSNRDEQHTRKMAVAPSIYTICRNKLLFPKDETASGTWITLHENGNAAVLLNGAFKNHTRSGSYKKSRGLILLEIINTKFPVRHFTRMDFANIEPFTIVVFEDNSLYECRWDGKQKHCVQLRKNRAHIWSSATLYSSEATKKREQWLAAFLNKHPNPTQQDIFHFHQFGGNGDSFNGLKIDRNGLVSTVSITSISLDNESGSMKYLDLKENKLTEKEIPFLYYLHDEALC